MGVKLSIITINYNNEIGLEKTILSVISQTYQDFEYIIIDGKSTDGSTALIEKYQSRISYWKSESDSGVYNAMNKGIAVAKGDFLLFLNSGDLFYDSNVLDTVLPNLNSSTSIFYGDAVFVKGTTEKLVKFPKKLNFSFFFDDSLCHQATFLNKGLFLENNYNENFKIVSDWEFNIKNICLFNVRYQHLNEIICYYDFDGISSTQKKLEHHERYEVFDNYFSAYLEDYKMLKIVSDKRIKNMIYIKQFSVPWIILKGLSKIILFFLPKQKITE